MAIFGICSGSHDMVVCRQISGSCWFWLAERVFLEMVHTTKIFVTLVGFSTGFATAMVLWCDFCKYRKFLHSMGMAGDWRSFSQFWKALVFWISFWEDLLLNETFSFWKFITRWFCLDFGSRLCQDSNRSRKYVDRNHWHFTLVCGWKEGEWRIRFESFCDPKDLLTWTVFVWTLTFLVVCVSL